MGSRAFARSKGLPLHCSLSAAPLNTRRLGIKDVGMMSGKAGSLKHRDEMSLNPLLSLLTAEISLSACCILLLPALFCGSTGCTCCCYGLGVLSMAPSVSSSNGRAHSPRHLLCVAQAASIRLQQMYLYSCAILTPPPSLTHFLHARMQSGGLKGWHPWFAPIARVCTREHTLVAYTHMQRCGAGTVTSLRSTNCMRLDVRTRICCMY